MNSRDFEDQIAQIMRRLHRLRSAQRGELDVRSIPVKRHFVPGFWVSRHSRTIYVKRKQRVATKARKAA